MGWPDDDTTVPDEPVPVTPAVGPDVLGDPFENPFTDEITLAADGDWDIDTSVIWDGDAPASGSDGDAVDLPPA